MNRQFVLFPVLMFIAIVTSLPAVSYAATCSPQPVKCKRGEAMYAVPTSVSCPTSGYVCKFVGSTTIKNTTTSTKTLSLGARGASVVSLQQALVALGLLAPDSATGYFGNLTRLAVQKFQKQNQIVSSGNEQSTGYGSVGPRTLSVIAKSLVGATGTTAPSSTQASVPAPQSSGTAMVNPPTNTSLTASKITEAPTVSGTTALHDLPAATIRFVPACVSLGIQTQVIACPVGQTGAQTQTRVSSCTSQTSVAEWGTWQTTSAECKPVITTAAQRSCELAGLVIPSGNTQTFYSNASVPFGSLCTVTQQSRSCADGTFLGDPSYRYVNCAVSAPASCTFGSQNIPHGSSVVAHQTASVSFGQSCIEESRVCSNGTMSGTFAYPSCSVTSAQVCSFNGLSITNGSTVSAYQSASVAYGQTCTPQTRACSNGTLSGTYANTSCTVGAGSACTWNGQSVANGTSVTAYQASLVAYGQTCTSQSRICSNGALSGSYQSGLCAVQSPASCVFNGQTLLSGQSISAYQTASVAYGQTCASQARTCTNGVLAGSYMFSACSVSAPVCVADATSPQTQALACPSGQLGSITQTRMSSCAANATAPTWSTWSTTANTCTTITAHAPALYAKSITPTFLLQPSRFALDLYALVLNRQADSGGLRGQLSSLNATRDYLASMRNFMGSQEFIGNVALHSASSYIDRLYSSLLGRSADTAGKAQWLSTTPDAANADPAQKWLDSYNGFAYSQEYVNRAPRMYDDYDAPLISGTPRIADLVSGAAYFPAIASAEVVSINFSTSHPRSLWDQKLPLFKGQDGAYYAVTRLYLPNSQGIEQYTIFLLRSNDNGRTFSEVGPIFEKDESHSYYDAHVSIDYSVFPTRYFMMLECAQGEHVSACVSETTEPSNPASWSTPRILIEGCDRNSSSGCNASVLNSASTPVLLIDGTRKYIAWSAMVDNQNNVEDVEKVITRGMEITGLDLSSRVAYANQGTELFGAEANTSCTSSWDCNNRNLQDWKKEGEEFYAIYNGGNYYGCIRPQGTPGTVDWGIGVSRASVAVTAYTPAPTKSIDSIVKNVCGISYGSVNNLNGELYLYYAAYTADGTNKTFRSKLVWR